MARGEILLIELSKRFGELTAVDAIDLHIAGGEFFSCSGLRLRQDDHAAHDRGLRAADRRPHPARRFHVAYTPPHKREREHGLSGTTPSSRT